MVYNVANTVMNVCGAHPRRLALRAARSPAGSVRSGALAGITPAPVLLEALRSFPVPTTPITLDPTRPGRRESLVDRKWGVRVNVAPSDLFHI
jgi:predicted transcriptional regulator of viral defense system